MRVRNLLACSVAASFLVPATTRAVDPGSELITCDRADDRVRIDTTSHLDPSCTWTRGVEITASNVTLDCQGAHISAPDRRFGVAILAPIDVALSNITVRNCHVEGFLNNLHIEREGFFALADIPEEDAYQDAWSNILIEDNTFLNSRGVGVFVDGFVTGVTLRNNHIEGSGSTGIYLEAGSKDNVVEDNQIVNNGYRENGPNGQFFVFGGVDFWFWGTGREGLAIDGSRNNRIVNNHFSTYGVRVEDDGAVVADNEFIGDEPTQQAVILGTRFRTSALGQPVDRTTVTGNSATIAGSTNPYRWIHGHTNTTFAGNESFGRVVGLCEGVQPPTTVFIFVVAFVVADPENPPTGGPPPVPPLQPLPPCPLTCASGPAVSRPSLVLRNLHTPPGDDVFVFNGDVPLAHPFAPALDPAATGVGLVILDATGARLVDVTVPSGAYDPATKVGWKAARGGNSWAYVNRSATPPGGITRVRVRHLARKYPGTVDVSVRGDRGSYPVEPTELPLEAFVVLDPPTAETGQCGEATFTGAPPCKTDGRTVRCK